MLKRTIIIELTGQTTVDLEAGFKAAVHKIASHAESGGHRASTLEYHFNVKTAGAPLLQNRITPAAREVARKLANGGITSADLRQFLAEHVDCAQAHLSAIDKEDIPLLCQIVVDHFGIVYEDGDILPPELLTRFLRFDATPLQDHPAA